MIGNDNKHKVETFEVINSDHGHHALRTAVGWVVNCHKRDSDISKMNKSFLVKSSSGIVHPICTLCSYVVGTLQNVNVLFREQIKFMKHVEKSTRQCRDHHYEISLPLRDPNLHLSIDESQALQRANQLEQKFLKDPQFFEDCQGLYE